jgi:hypothetical protein
MAQAGDAANANRRPISVTIVAVVYLAVGTLGFIFHLREVLARSALHREDAPIELTELIAFVCGVFLLRAQNWARWLALAWMLFHVIFSALGAFRAFVVHCVLCIVVAWALFYPAAARYFQGPRAPEP